MRSVPAHTETREVLQERKEISAGYYNRSARPLPSLTLGQEVWHRNPERKQWEPAMVKDISRQPCSYAIETGSGNVRCNRIDLKARTATTLVKVATPAKSATQGLSPSGLMPSAPLGNDHNIVPAATTAPVRQSTQSMQAPNRLDL